MRKAVITIGIPASGKSTYAADLERQGYRNVNLDDCRALVSGDAGDQRVTAAALILHSQQLTEAIATGLPLIISDTNLHRPFLTDKLARLQGAGYHVTAAIFKTPLAICEARNRQRERVVPSVVLHNMHAQLEDLLLTIDTCGFDALEFHGLN